MATHDTVAEFKDLPSTFVVAAGPRQGDPLLVEWHRQLHTMHVAYRRAESRAATFSRAFGAAIAVLSAIAGTSIFATIENDPRIGWRIAVGLIAVLAAVLGALQSSLAFGEQQARHRSAAEGYGALRRDVEDWLITHRAGPIDAAKLAEWETKLKERWNATEAGAPSLPNGLYRKAERDVSSRERV
jgi:hypothetical protein